MHSTNPHRASPYWCLLQQTLWLIAILVSACVASTLLSCTPKSNRARLAETVPQGGSILMSIEYGDIAETQSFEELFGRGSDIDWAGILSTCGVRISGSQLVFAAHSDGQRLMAAFEGEGIGQSPAINCLEKTLSKFLRSKDLWTFDNVSGELKFRSYALWGWAPRKDTLILSTTNWRDDIRARNQGTKPAAIYTDLAAATRQVNYRLPVWVVAHLPDDDPLAAALGTPGLTDLSGSFYFNENVHTSIWFRFQSLEHFEYLREILEAARTVQPPPQGVGYQLLRLIARDCLIDKQNTVVSVRGHVAPEDLRPILSGAIETQPK